jgi:hypothetical protein
LKTHRVIDPLDFYDTIKLFHKKIQLCQKPLRFSPL